MEDFVKVEVFCQICKRKEVYKDETLFDCWWQMDMDGWQETEDLSESYFCKKCLES